MQALGQIPRLLVVQLGPMRPLKIQLIVVKGLPMGVNLGTNLLEDNDVNISFTKEVLVQNKKGVPLYFGPGGSASSSSPLYSLQQFPGGLKRLCIWNL